VTTGPAGDAPVFQPGRVYLGWQYALAQPEPGPPPRRPVPPEPEQLNPGWLSAQRREERLLSRYWRLAAGACLAALALVLALGLLGLLNPALTALAAVVFAVLGARCGLAVWRGHRDLRATIAAEKHRVTAVRGAQESQLFGWLEDHARLFRDWQAQQQAFARQPLWYPVALPDRIDRVDVAGGTLAGWSALFTMTAAARLAAGGDVTLLDLSQGAVGRDLVALAPDLGVQPLVWVLPGDLPRFDLGVGMPAGPLADVLAASVAADPPAGGPADPARDHAILARLLGALGDGAGIANVLAGLRALGQVGDPREDIGRGLLTAAQLDRITRLYGRGAADGMVTERAWALEARLHPLAAIGSAPVRLPPSALRVIALDPGGAGFGHGMLASYVTVSLTHLLRQAPPGPPWRHTLCVAGAERLGGEVIDRLCDACETARSGLVLAYRSIPAPVRERLGRGNAAVAFMRLGNADDAKAAAEQIGTEHRFVLSQLTDTVGASVTDTSGWSYTSTVGTADSLALSASTSQTTGRSRGRGHTRADLAPFGAHTGSASAEHSNSAGTSDSESITAGINASTSWGLSTSAAIGVNESLARTTQRSREFLVEPHQLQQLPPSAVIVSYAAPGGRQVVLADANPAILTLPSVSPLNLAEAAEAPARPPGPVTGWPESAPSPAGMADRADPDRWPDPDRASGPGGHAGPVRAGEGDPAGAAGPPQPRPRSEPSAPVSWRSKKGRPPPNLGPPPEPLDWRKRPGR
jgi:hypothetical protein